MAGHNSAEDRFRLRVGALRLVVLALFCIGVSGCASRPEFGTLALSDVQVEGAETHDIMIVTTRARDDHPDTFFSGERAPQVNFAQASISVPPSHKAGEIEWPDSLPGDPKTDFVARRAGYVQDRAAFTREINQRLAKLPKGKRNIFLFIHGYNTRFPEGLYRFTQMVHDGKLDTVPVLFTWASRGKLQDYLYDLNSAAIARGALEETFKQLSQTNADNITILAHSMGTWLLMETASRSDRADLASVTRKIDKVILAAPDIDIDLFKAQLRRIGRPKKPFIVIVSKDDRALRLSRRIAGGKERVGAYSNDLELAELGAIVVDVTDLESLDGSHHSKFAQLAEFNSEFRDTLGRSNLTSIADMSGAPDQGNDLAGFIGNTVALPIRIITAPVTLATGGS
ncbi:alpha/beta hydrolase [Roseibium aggregatum]|uniref:Alpha/beta hydrolase n=1 Tax=Roseibium aggregatum TaxID=187304 RepID=A0A939EBS3_9HYPH|nr:alpha/beta hydrolase [Roseibium aggregatum]MBN9670265.1 alpha/beta hydrolase [Roseibium aggregatum]